MKKTSPASTTLGANRRNVPPAKKAGSAASPRDQVANSQSELDQKIASELAPAVAIALLEKTKHVAGTPPPALDCLAAAASPAATEGNVRVQLMFENGTVLPVEMSAEAGRALSNGLVDQLPTETKAG